MAVALVAFLRHVFTLLRQGDRNAKILLRFRAGLRRKPIPFWKKWGGLVVIPLRHYSAVLKALPRIAGANAEDYQHRLYETHELVEGLSSELPSGRSFLTSSSSRKLQQLLVPVVFEDFFSIRIKSEQANAFAFYAESSEVVRDFLDFCRHHNQFGSKDELVVALPVFAQLVKECFWLDPKNDKHGPQPGELCQKSLPAWDRVRLQDNWFRPDRSLISLYWSNIEVKEIIDRMDLSPSACEQFEQHLAVCAESRTETLLGVLAFEMHHHACFDLARIAIQFGPPSSSGPNESSEVTEQLGRWLIELNEILQQTIGRASNKPPTLKLLRAR